MSWRVLASMRRLMLPFVSADEDRSATAAVSAPRLPEDAERFDMAHTMPFRIHNVNTDGRGNLSGEHCLVIQF